MEHAKEPKWLEWAKQIQAIAQTGLTYSKDIYDLERYEELRKLSIEIMAEYTGTDMQTVSELFARETGYATPKVDVRAVVFREGKLLLVRETLDGCWSLPGGWADIGLSPSEVAVKEVREEAGYEVKPSQLLAVCDKKLYSHPPSPYHVYKMFILCEIIGGQAQTGIETSHIGFFDEEELPELSVERNTESQVRMMFEYGRHPERPVHLD